jgi:hypothetical protein
VAEAAHQGGDFEVLAKELMERASMGRKQRQNNPTRSASS